MRTSLQMLPREKQGAVVVTSCGAGDGKTFCAVNLAVALAAAGKRVLVVDGDLRRPSLHKVFRLGRTQGLSDVLSEQAARDEVILPSDVPGLDVLPSGPIPPNPSELLGAPALDPALEAWRVAYDHLIFDAPPVLGLSDAVVLARRIGYAILVVRAGQTTDRALRHASELLQGSGIEVLGVVLNGTRARDEEAYGFAMNYWPEGYVDSPTAGRTPADRRPADR